MVLVLVLCVVAVVVLVLLGLFVFSLRRRLIQRVRRDVRLLPAVGRAWAGRGGHLRQGAGGGTPATTVTASSGSASSPTRPGRGGSLERAAIEVTGRRAPRRGGAGAAVRRDRPRLYASWLPARTRDERGCADRLSCGVAGGRLRRGSGSMWRRKLRVRALLWQLAPLKGMRFAQHCISCAGNCATSTGPADPLET